MFKVNIYVLFLAFFSVKAIADSREVCDSKKEGVRLEHDIEITRNILGFNVFQKSTGYRSASSFIGGPDENGLFRGSDAMGATIIQTGKNSYQVDTSTSPAEIFIDHREGLKKISIINCIM